MMSFLKEVKFPIIADRDGDFSRAFGVLKVKDGQFGASRALVILDQEGRMVHMSLLNEYIRSYPGKVVELIKHLKDSRSNKSITVFNKKSSWVSSTKKMLEVDSSSSSSIPDEEKNGTTKPKDKAGEKDQKRVGNDIKSPAKTSVDLKVKNEMAKPSKKDDDKMELKEIKNAKPDFAKVKANVAAKEVDQGANKNVKGHKETKKTNTKARAGGMMKK